MIKKIDGWGNAVGICLLVCFISYGLIMKFKREKNASYVRGISLGVHKGVKGNTLLDYKFEVGSNSINGFVPGSFCKQCNYECCDSGAIVIVRYETNNPKNNDLVVELPKGETLSNN